MPHIQSDNAICIAIRKAITKSLYLQNTYFSKKDAGVIKKYKNRKAIAVGCVKKSTRSFSLTLICQKYMAIKYSGKLFKFFFSGKPNFTNKITISEEDETVISDSDMVISDLENRII